MATHTFSSLRRGVAASAKLAAGMLGSYAACGASTHVPIARRPPLGCPNAHRVAAARVAAQIGRPAPTLTRRRPPAPSLRWPLGVMDERVARAFQALAPAQSWPTEKPAAQPLLALCESSRRVSNGQEFAWPSALVTP